MHSCTGGSLHKLRGEWGRGSSLEDRFHPEMPFSRAHKGTLLATAAQD